MMYGSIHTHFESRFDTANNMKEMCLNFMRSGAKKVAVTEHGEFSSFEDLRDIVAGIKTNIKEGKLPEFDGNADLEIIPGVEGYFGKDRAHMVLIAKDYEGYVSLCKIISESNENIDDKGFPIITEENLSKNVAKGHLICTSACVGGLFGQLLGAKQNRLEEKLEKLNSSLKESGYAEALALEEHYNALIAEKKSLFVTKKVRTDAEKKQDEVLLSLIANNDARVAQIEAEMESRKKEFEENSALIKQLNKAGFSKKFTTLQSTQEELDALKEDWDSGYAKMEAHALFEYMIGVFGEEDFYFELQNHGIPIEDKVYNEIVRFACECGHPQFIASNDIHLGVRKSDPNYETARQKRNVIKYTRFNQYSPETEDDKEYTIKDDEELKEELMKILHDVNLGGVEMTAEEIADAAIGNIRGVLEQCNVEFPKEQHYPQFCEDENAAFEKLVRDGIKKKFPNGFPKGQEKIYEDRLEYELGIIKSMGYSGYHLIVADYLEYGRLLGYLPTPEEVANAPNTIEELDAYITQKGYPRIGYNIGPGRGSGVGSLCCYAAGITDIDPIPYGLLFERFLNPERVSMPKQYWAFSVNAITQRCA